MQRSCLRVVFVTGLLTLFAPSVPICAQQAFPVREELGVRTAMRDGVVLVADIFRPDVKDQTFPVLLQRTPYNRKGGSGEGRELASHGYIVVIQDTRGRYDSRGDFYTFRYESQDGYDTVEWAAKLPQSNGSVGMYGGSYVGATQMLASIAKPPHLVAVFPYITASEYYEGWTYQGGAFEQWFAESWTTGLAQDTLAHKVAGLANPREWSYTLPVDQYPILKAPPSMDDVAPYFDDWVRHETDDAYWKPWKISDHYTEMTVKGLHGGGWHDIFLKGTINNYMGLHEHAATPEARASQRLLIGPWAHTWTSPEGKVGDVVFGKQAVLDMTATIAAWSDWALKGIQNEFADDTPVRIFVMGTNVWRDEHEFPLARQRLTRYYLHSGGSANGAAGDGTLSTAEPESEQADVFEYDPSNPVPTIGGRLCCGNQTRPGPFDQSPNDSRQDVLVFSTPPLEKDTEVTGLIRLELYAATTAQDTDFTALLADVDPSGYVRFLTDGIIRARYRKSTQVADPITPGQIYLYDIDLWATSNVFKEGHRIRLYVSSSNFPRFNRNLNTGQPIAGGSGWVTARQTILHDGGHPSALVLPVIP